MFNIKDSYITPIIISYVDKYIKNVRLEDTQLSLWSGEAVFHNLSLRLDVLEEELALPFSFVSGQIHELAISVPWTKLHSEPIKVTINTIECVLKLKGDVAENFDAASSSSTGSREAKRRDKRPKVESPPSYMQSLVNRIVSNISVQCNNLILKYVEEDMVLSLNVRSLLLQSANGQWQPAFTELSTGQLVLRKLVNLHDLTVCLDRRNASGKIEFYEEPLLYRCSLELHLSRTYASLAASKASSMRIDVRCCRMDFSVSDQQLPMLLRVLRLALALYLGELRENTGGRTAELEDADRDEHMDQNQKDDGGGSWVGWAWNLMPSVLPSLLDEEDWESEQQSKSIAYMLQLGYFVDNLSFTFKASENISERSYYGPKKMKFHPLVVVDVQGCYMESHVAGMKAVGVTLGASQVVMRPVGDTCACGVKEINTDNTVYLSIGEKSDNYLKGSLFDPENCNTDKSVILSWEEHLASVTESALLERTPGFAMDYRYMLDLADDITPEEIAELGNDLEFSNLPEQALCRFVVGPTQVFVCSGSIHRAQLILKAASFYNYPPYSEPIPDPTREELISPSQENITALESIMPLRAYQLTIFKPIIHLFLADHPSYDAHKSYEKARKKVNQNISAEKQLNCLPRLSIECQCLDATHVKPMYPRRLISTVCQLPSPSEDMFTNCHRHSSVKLLGLGCHLVVKQQPMTVLVPSHVAMHWKQLVMPHLWTKLDLALIDARVYSENLTATASKAQLLIMNQIIRSCFMSEYKSTSVYEEYCTSSSNLPYLEFTLEGLSWQKVYSPSSATHKILLKSARIFALRAAADQVLILSNSNDHKLNENNEAMVSVVFQHSTLPNTKILPSLLLLKLQTVDICLDPLLLDWFKFAVIQDPDHNAPQTEAPVHVTAVPKLSRRKSGSLESRSRTTTAPQESVHSLEVPYSFEQEVSLPRSKRASSSVLELPTIEKFGWKTKLLDWYAEWCSSLVSVDISPCSIYVPSRSLSSLGAESIPDTFLRSQSSSNIVIVKLPSVVLKSLNFKPGMNIVMAKLPVTLPSSIWQADKETFPWSLSISNLQCDTVLQGLGKKLLHPLSANCTVGLSSKKDQNHVSLVGLYIHVDTPLLKIGISHEQVEIVTDIVNKILHLLPREEKLSIPVEKSCEPSATPPATITAASVHQQPQSLGSISEPSNQPSSTHAEGDTEEIKSGIKTTVWLQWMMVRCLFSLYTDNKKLTVDVEDIMTSVDAQQVYLKIKTKVVTASIKHFYRNKEENKWLPDQHMGIILKINDDFVTRSSPQSSVTPTSASPSRSMSSVLNVSTHSLLEMTFTRAQSRNVHQRWSQQVVSQQETSTPTTTASLVSSTAPRSITEIVMKLCPVDVILPSNVMTNFLPIFKPLLNIESESNIASSPVGLNNNTLPLLYIDTKDVRIFLPVSLSTSSPDFCIIQVDTIHLAPHVHNPLSRVYVRPDIYHMAQQANILSVPGAQVEDRQYQLDICKFAIHTGAWSEIHKFFQKQNEVSSGEPVSENPAVEWNKLALGKDSLHQSEISLSPLVHRFDVSFMVAPAIVYQQEARADVLVCGHSAELNVTSDIDVTVSTAQLQLVSCLFSEWLNLLTAVASLLAETHPHKPCDSPFQPTLPDSGIDDQSSICSPPIRTQIKNKQTEFIPAEILVTASRITFILYDIQEGDVLEKKTTHHKLRKVPQLDDLPADQGYEASEESSVECVSESGLSIQPLLYVLIAEPHCVVACHSLKQRMEVSCFDLSVRTSNDNYVIRTTGSSKQIPKVDKFTTSILETRGGDPHPKTGIPPSLITMTWSHFMSKSGGELCLELGRPTHIHFDESVKNLLQIQSSLSKCVSSLHLNSKNTSQDTAPSFLSHLGEVAYVSVSSRQILLTIKPNDDEISFSVSSISGSLSSRTSVWKGMGAIKSQLDVQSAMLKLHHNGSHKIFIQPLSFTCDTTISWETWLADLKFPLIQTSVNCDCITIDIHPDNVDCIKNIIQVAQPYLDKYNSKSSSKERSFVDSIPNPKQEEHYRDDLRAGAFQFVNSGGPQEHPLPYQVLFCQEPLAMSWRYPQPRTLSRVDVFPVPFITAGLPKMDNDQVECILEYWSECEAKFITYVLFHLSESQVSRLDLPVLTDKRHVITSSLWRVVLHPRMEDEYEKHTDQRVSILPRALAACMRVDSFFSPTLVPQIQGALSIASFKLNIISKIGDMATKLPQPLSRYKYDGMMPESLPLLTISFSTNNFHLSKWYCGTTLVEFETNPECNVIDMASLTNVDIVESFRAQGKVYLAQDTKGNVIREISTMTKPIHIQFGATTGHTVATTLQLWRQTLDHEDNTNYVIPARYVICNDLQQTIKIRQCDTNEEILITSRQCHMYAWKSMCLKQNLQIALAENNWEWSQALSIENEHSEVLYFDNETMRVGVVWQVKSLSSTQKIITLSGQLVISNNLNENLELQLLTHKPTEDGHVLSTQSEILTVQGNSTSVSFLLQKNRKIALKVRFQSLSAAWSGEIPIAINASITLPWLVKVPLQEKGQFLSIWCRIFIQDMVQGSKVLAVMSPLYSVRSLLPSSLRLAISTPGLQVETSVLTEGQGKIQQLYCPGTAEHSHQVQFLFPEGESTENNEVTSVPLSYTMLQQPSSLTFCGSSIDIDAICLELEKQQESPSAVWPYLQQKMIEGNMEWVTSMHRGAQASVSYKLPEPHYSTLLLQLQPWALLANLLHLPLQLVFEQRKYHMPSNGIIVPPNIEGTFHLSLEDTDGEGMWMSSPLQLASSEWNGSFYMPRISGVVPLNGSVHTTIAAPNNKLLLVTVSSKIIQEESQLRVLSVHPTVLLSCLPDIDLSIVGVCVPAQTKSYSIPSLESSTLVHKGKNTQPFVTWHRLNSSDNAPVSALDLAFYILCHQREGSQQWSCPLLIPLPGAVEGCTSRQSFSIGNQAFVLTTHFRSGQVYAVVSRDPQPQLCILNNCHFPLVCAQAKQGSSRGSNGGLAAEESEHFSWHCHVEPGDQTYYTMPSIQHNFPELQTTPIVVSLLLAVSSSHGGHVVWSEPVNCHVNSEQFVSLGSQGDVSIRMTSKFGGVTQVLVECVSRIEISAKEIRARLQPSSQQWQQQIQQQELQNQHKTESPDICKQQESEIRKSPQEICKITSPDQEIVGPKTSLFLAIYIASIQVSLVSDTSAGSSELMLLSLDHTCLTVRPTNVKTTQHQEVVLTIADIQLDNLTFHQGGFDFPVILTRQDRVQHSSPRNIISLEQVMEKIRSNAMLNVHITQELFRNMEPTIISLAISIKPVNIYLEDTLLMQFNKILQRFSPTQLIFMPVKELIPNSNYQLPLDVKWEAQQTASPIQMQSLVIEPVSVMVSLHTSLKVFIALDSSPLHFSAFERHRVCTTSYRLGHALTRHYLSGALFRAGWLVGSLELLGNPSGFALTVGSGLRDFVCLPYLGILQGPWGFLAGVTHGSASLMKHITAGTLSSITNLASSVARNLDRCSLDREHVERAEEARRKRPQGVGQGMLQGFSSFGISLLGAVSGIAHHPLQALVNQDSSSSPITGLVTGVGLGLVGVITKPLSGAAELVALTGQGLLHGTGWSSLPKTRRMPVTEYCTSRPASLLHFSWKLLPPSESPLLLVIEASAVNPDGKFDAVTLVVSPQLLTVVAADTDQVRTSIPVRQIQAYKSPSDLTLICLSTNQFNSFTELSDNPNSRVEDYLRLSSLSQSECHSDSADLNTSGDTKSCSHIGLVGVLHIHVNPAWRQHLLNILQLTQRHAQGRGFPNL